MKDPFSDMPNESVKAIAYCRMGSGRQTKDSLSLQAQRQQITQAAKNQNIEIIAWFEFTGSVNNPLEETALQEAHEYCMDNPDIQYLLATEPSRISRFISGFRYWEDSFYSHGVSIKFTQFDERDYGQNLINMAVYEFNARSQAAQKKRGGAA